MQQKIKTLIIFTLAVAMLTACKKDSPSERSVKKTEKKKQVTSIGFSIDTLALERWQRDLDVFINRLRERGAEAIVQNAGNSVEEQNKQLRYLMERNVNVIVAVAKDQDSLTEILTEIHNKGIKIISYDRLITNAPVDLYISVNTERVGELMAQRFLASNVGKRWYLILGPQEDYNMTLMQRGIELTTRGKDVLIEGIFYTDGWNYDLSYNAAVDLITKGPIPDAIICGNDAVAGSVLNAMDDYYPEHHIPICGQDADIAACQNIVRGKQDFTVYKPITTLAEKAADCAVSLAQGMDETNIVPKGSTINNGYDDIPVIWLEPEIVTKSNIDDIVIKSGFHTYGEVYRQ